MSPRDRWILSAFFILAALGFVLPFWPLSALGVVLMSLWGRWLAALFVGLLLDLAWGAPLGVFHVVYFPFALLAVAAALVRVLGVKYFINRAPPEHL